MLNKHSYYNSLWVILILFSISLASQSSMTRVKEIEVLYKQLKLEKALEIGNELLANPQGLTANELAFIHKYLGVIYFSMGSPDSSRFHFLSYLNLQPEGQLDPVSFSPKIVDFFEDIKREYTPESVSDNVQSMTKYIFVDDPRPGATWRSAIIPGWGQIYKKQKRRGIVFGASFFSSAIMTGIAYSMEDKYHQDYLNSQEVSDIDNNYAKYNDWYKIRRSLSWITAGIWIANIADALWSPFPGTKISVVPTASTPLSIKIDLN